VESAAAPRRGEATAPRRRAVSLSLLVAGAALAAGIVLVYRFDPAAAGFFPKCLFFSATGLACPGCGTTRALHALLHLDPLAAFRWNPLPFVLFPAGALWLAAERRRRGRPPSRLARALPWALAGLILAFTVWRNLPDYPFARLSRGLLPPAVAASR
jgi:hypothetical protein